MEKKIITQEMRAQLRAEFPAKAYSKHPTKTYLTTLKAMYVTERLNDVFGVGRWTINIEVIERTSDYVLVQGEFISKDFDVILPKQFGGHGTTGKGTEIADGYKSALTDCQSKIASYLEIGIEMFKGNITVGGSSNSNKPELPWLNAYTSKDKKEFTDLFKKVKEKVTAGTAISKIKEHYKLSKETEQLLTSK